MSYRAILLATLVSCSGKTTTRPPPDDAGLQAKKRPALDLEKYGLYCSGSLCAVGRAVCNENAAGRVPCRRVLPYCYFHSAGGGACGPTAENCERVHAKDTKDGDRACAAWPDFTDGTEQPYDPREGLGALGGGALWCSGDDACANTREACEAERAKATKRTKPCRQSIMWCFELEGGQRMCSESESACESTRVNLVKAAAGPHSQGLIPTTGCISNAE